MPTQVFGQHLGSRTWAWARARVVLINTAPWNQEPSIKIARKLSERILVPGPRLQHGPKRGNQDWPKKLSGNRGSWFLIPRPRVH